MNLRKRVLSVVALITFLPMAALAATTLSLPAGTDLNATIDGTLDSQSAHVGDTFTAHVQPPYPYDNAALAGAIITGHITNVVHAGQGTKPQLALKFDTISLRDGRSAPVNGYVTEMQQNNKVRNGARVAAYTLGGMIAGNILGKWTGNHSAVPAIAGAAGGFILGNNYKADFQVPAGSNMTVKLRTTTVIRRQARRY